MNNIFAKVKGPRKNPYFKLISDQALFDNVIVDISNSIPYNSDHNLDEESWFKISNFSQQVYCLEFLNTVFDSKDFDDLTKDQFSKISFIFSVQENDFYFQNITPSLFIRRKFL